MGTETRIEEGILTTTPVPNTSGIVHFPVYSAGQVHFLHRLVASNHDVDIGVATPATENSEPVNPPMWFGPTISAIANLNWDDSDWKDGAEPPHPVAAARLLLLLSQILGDDAPPPSICPTWRGGVQAEWHPQGCDLEIEAVPDGSFEYYFACADEEYEGPLDADLHRLKRQVSCLSASAS